MIGLALLIGIQVRAIWQVAALLLIGWLTVWVLLWSSKRLFPRAVVYAANCTGHIAVSNGSSSQAVVVKVKVVPSRWRRTIGWLSIAVILLAEVGVALFSASFLLQALGG